jgi:hypothetical protein
VFDPSREETDERRFQAAAMAMQSLIDNENFESWRTSYGFDMHPQTAITAVKFADALIAELERSEK